jgi:threonine dehydrogenase-like Zn-dependent dehydrogenase
MSHLACIKIGPGNLAVVPVASEDKSSDGFVKVRPLAVALCGSDHTYVVQDPSKAPPGRGTPDSYIVGHECCVLDGRGLLCFVNPHVYPLAEGAKRGTRDNLGENISRILSVPPTSLGQPYAATPPYPGFLQQEFWVHPSRLVPLAEGTDPIKASLIEPLSCAMEAVMMLMKRISRSAEGGPGHPLSNTMLVINGDGSQALMAAMLLRHINDLGIYYNTVYRSEKPGRPSTQTHANPVENLQIVMVGVSEDRAAQIRSLFPPTGDSHTPSFQVQVIPKDAPVDKVTTSRLFAESIPEGTVVSGALECSGAPSALQRLVHIVDDGAPVVSVGRPKALVDYAQGQRKELHLSSIPHGMAVSPSDTDQYGLFASATAAFTHAAELSDDPKYTAFKTLRGLFSHKVPKPSRPHPLSGQRIYIDALGSAYGDFLAYCAQNPSLFSEVFPGLSLESVAGLTVSRSIEEGAPALYAAIETQRSPDAKSYAQLTEQLLPRGLIVSSGWALVDTQEDFSVNLFPTYRFKDGRAKMAIGMLDRIPEMDTFIEKFCKIHDAVNADEAFKKGFGAPDRPLKTILDLSSPEKWGTLPSDDHK